MGEVVNLRLHRKKRARAEREAEAAENRVRFGRSRPDRKLAEAERALEVRRLDGQKLERDTPEVCGETDDQASGGSRGPEDGSP